MLHCQCNIDARWSSASPCIELLSCCSCNIYACWPSVILLIQTPLLFKYAYWLSAAMRWMLAGTVPLNQHACPSFATQSCMSSAIPVGMVSHYRPRLLVRCLAIGHTCWCGVSLSALPAGVVPHYQHYLLVC